MKTRLVTDLSIREICEGFKFDDKEGKGLYGLNGRLVIQPEYQRNYIYAQANKEQAVVESVMVGYPLGLIYFNLSGYRTGADGQQEELYEVLDGQQRITSLGRYMGGYFSVQPKGYDYPLYFDSMPPEMQERFLDTKLLIYICQGEEREIKEWFRTINIAGIPLNEQELLNAVYSGPFVTAAKAHFSNSNNYAAKIWSIFVRGSANRQDFLSTALDWVSRGEKEEYMSQHRNEHMITELKEYFKAVIDWSYEVFTKTYKEMQGLPWNVYYETYHKNSYVPAKLTQRVEELMADEYVENKRGIFEYVLGGETEPQLLNVRVFDKKVAREVYLRQTEEAKKKEVSNCPLCASSGLPGREKMIYDFKEMDADHVTAWSKGGATDINNCQLLCKTHNRSKGNR